MKLCPLCARWRDAFVGDICLLCHQDSSVEDNRCSAGRYKTQIPRWKLLKQKRNRERRKQQAEGTVMKVITYPMWRDIYEEELVMGWRKMTRPRVSYDLWARGQYKLWKEHAEQCNKEAIK